MCGIAGIVNKNYEKVAEITHKLKVMGQLVAHRGPDDHGFWHNEKHSAGFAHRRLSIIDLTSSAHQPMISKTGMVIVFNGEIYNHIELRQTLSAHWDFVSNSDTEVILAAYHRFGKTCVDHLEGMFAFAIWDGERLFCARDRFGIKPFYYLEIDDCFLFASEAKALLPFVKQIATDRNAFVEYITFQHTIGEQTLFAGIKQLLPAQALQVCKGSTYVWQYWDIKHQIDYDHTSHYFEDKLRYFLERSITLHCRSDVPVGCYVSGGVDSSLIAALASRHVTQQPLPMFHGRFTYDKNYDESRYAHDVATLHHGCLHVLDIQESDFINNINNIIYHMDYPVAGPGAFPQYMVSAIAAKQVKVVLGGQGGDEIFGGYARYLIAYFEQCIKAAIEGTYLHGNFVVSAETIFAKLSVLKEYKPLIKHFWREGLFDSLERRYFRLVDRGLDLAGEVTISEAESSKIYEQFVSVYNAAKYQNAESYLDSMTHFDLKCLLPGLLHVEDRVSMAHGLEARVPFLDHMLIDFVSTIPANIKFHDGQLKHLLKYTFKSMLPNSVLHRTDKMGFPVPLNEWINGPLNDYVLDILQSGANRSDCPIDYKIVIGNLNKTGKFSRKLWGFLCYELWQQQFHDKAHQFRKLAVAETIN